MLPTAAQDPDNAPVQHPTSAMAQIVQVAADLIKAIVVGIPVGRLGVVCRFLIICEVLFFFFGIVAMMKGIQNIVWGCFIAMVAGGAALMLSYGTPNDGNLSAGQEARVEQILGKK
jgi:hypothetical protein